MKDKLKLFCGNATPRLAAEICNYLGIKVGDALVSQFSDGETRVKINEDVRGTDAFVVQSTCPPVNENLMELLILIDALKRASAERITAVVPYFGYARQDRKDQPRVPITAKLVANLITVAGANRLLTMDLHAGQIQGFFDIPVDHLFAAPILIDHFSKFDRQKTVAVSSDVGGIKMARAFAKRLGCGLAIVDKRRVDAQSAEVMNLMGDVSGKDTIVVDDMVTTAGSLTEAACALQKFGAMDIYGAITHPVFSGPAITRIDSSPMKEVVVTNTIPICDSKMHPKLTVLSVAGLLGEAIKRIHMCESVSSLFI
jgi:ribose-phosphate pyrophosphokinase